MRVALTIDVDPDANRPTPDGRDVVSLPGGQGACVSACVEGLARLWALLKERGVPATFFWEGRTLQRVRSAEPGLFEELRSSPLAEHGAHGWRHEDFTGRHSGRPLSLGETAAVLDLMEEAFRGAFGRRPRSFRAPFCRLTSHLRRELAGRGYLYDATLTRRGQPPEPYLLQQEPPLWELPLWLCEDEAGRPISAYLWQLCEGRREAGQYLRALGRLADRRPGALLQLAVHLWHLVVDEQGRPHSSAARARLEGELARLLDGLRGPDLRWATLADHLEGWAGPQA